MKRLLLCVLALLLLCGCSAATPEATTPTTQPTTIPISEPELLPSIYDPEHPIEQRTKGAVTAYKLDDDCSSIAFMGENLLLFSYDGFGPTRLMRLNTRDFTVDTTVELLGKVLPGGGGLRITTNRLGYYSTVEHVVIILDSSLREISRIPLPDHMDGLPVLSQDLTEAYYCAGTDIYACNLETGISRLLRQSASMSIRLEDVFWNDTILVCTVTESEEQSFTEFVSAESGETLGMDSGLLRVDTCHQRWYLERQEGIITERLFGQLDTPTVCIYPKGTEELISVLPMHSLLEVYYGEYAGIGLRLYDFESGKCSAKIRLQTLSEVHGVTADPSGKYLWFLSADSQGYDTLYRWELEKTPAEDDTIYTSLRYTQENPDREGLDACRARADELEARYGVEILLEKELAGSQDYAFTYEHHPDAFNIALDALEEALEIFPEGFFETVGKVSVDGKVHIGIVRSLYGRSSNVPRDTDNAQYWTSGKAHIVLSAGENMQESFFRGVGLVLDTYILNEALAYDAWDTLNPRDFVYDENYTVYTNRTDSPWLEGESRAFVSSFAMTYPREDRAQLFISALQPGNAELFRSQTMQKKLLQICKGIREAFEWKKDERVFPWEQYLENPLAYGS